MNTKLSIHIATILLLSVLFAGLASAQQMNYQGRLTDASGNGLTDGSYNLRFNVYTDPAGGSPAWGPSDVAATLVNGRFNVILGEDDDTTPTPRKLKDAFTTDTARYLGITLIDAVTNPGNVEISPRQQILSSPNAMFANHAANADTATTATTADNATTAETAANFTSVVLKTDETNARVGVGVDKPNINAKLHVKGDAETAAMQVDVNNVPKLIVNTNGGLTVGDTSPPPANGLRVSGDAHFLLGDLRVDSGSLFVQFGETHLGWYPNFLGKYGAVASPEDSLLIVRGLVKANGDIETGKGFTATRIATGQYRIDFDFAFADRPSVSGTLLPPNTDNFISVAELTRHICVLSLVDNDGATLQDNDFTFMAIGARRR